VQPSFPPSPRRRHRRRVLYRMYNGRARARSLTFPVFYCIGGHGGSGLGSSWRRTGDRVNSKKKLIEKKPARYIPYARRLSYFGPWGGTCIRTFLMWSIRTERYTVVHVHRRVRIVFTFHAYITRHRSSHVPYVTHLSARRGIYELYDDAALLTPETVTRTVFFLLVF